jgi:hypothetical protein
MRPAGIAFIGVVGLVLVFGAVVYVQVALCFLATILCLLIALGFVWQGHRARRFWIPMRAVEGEQSVSGPGRLVNIEGRSFPIQRIPPRLEFTVLCRNLYTIFAVGVIGGVTALASVVVSESFLRPSIDRPHYFEFYGLCYLMVVLMIPAGAWLDECSLMRSAGITLANVSLSRNGSFGTLWITYQFTDPMGGYHGGSVIDFGGIRNDQLKVVFCNPRNPEFNKLSCALLFHRLEWAEGSSSR